MTQHNPSTAPADNFLKNAGANPPPAGGAALSVDEQLCLNLRGRNLSCDACERQCPAGALELSTHAVALDTARCSACGACLPACPAGAFRLRDFSPADFLRRLQGQEEARIHCPASAGKNTDDTLPCLHLLDARLVAAAFSNGTKTFHLDGLEHCRQCDRGNAVNHVTATDNRLRQWFGDNAAPRLLVAGMPLALWLKDRHSRREPAQISRRQFFRHVGARVMASANRPPPGNPDNDYLQLDNEAFHAMDIRRQRPADYQSLFADNLGNLPWQERKIPWHARGINNDTCNACLACGRHCPTGALRVERSDTAHGISFESRLCTDCDLCARLCPMDAIERRRVRQASEITATRSLLMHREIRGCRHCGEEFSPQAEDDTLCPACNNEQKLKSEWLAHCAH